MSESGQSTIGQALRDAREAQGITLEDAAARLRLMHRQIEAMETDDFDSLGQPVFARGFVRNYARLLGLDPDGLLVRMEGAPAEPAAVSQVEAPAPRSFLTSPWLLFMLLGMLLVVTVPVGLYLWLNSGVDDVPVVRVTSTPPRLAPAAAPSVVEPTPAPVEPDVTVPAEVVDVPAVSEPPVVGGVVTLEFGDESWTEIKDASGQILHRKLNQPGSSIEVRGKPPFEMVIGNAAQARMTYNGRPIDLKPFIDVTVARFTLEE